MITNKNTNNLPTIERTQKQNPSKMIPLLPTQKFLFEIEIDVMTGQIIKVVEMGAVFTPK